MPEGGTLRIATRGVTLDGSDIDLAAGAYVELSVEDTGSGMPPEVVARALEPFFTNKDVGAGTGPGLSMAFGVATQSGGTLRSTVGEGTCVTFLLPCTSPNHDTESPVLRGHSVPSDDLSGLRIAAVDDDPDVRQFVADCVMQQGADCETFDGCHSFLARFAPSQWDIVLIDFAMPGLNGAEVARRVRRIDPSVPVIIMTGYANSAALDAILGNVRVIRKPFGIDDLLAEIQTLRDT